MPSDLLALGLVPRVPRVPGVPAIHDSARICTRYEILDSYPMPAPGADAWTVGPDNGDDGANKYNCTNYGTSATPTWFSNTSYANNFTGFVRADGEIGSAPCNTALVVACCSYSG